MSHVNWENSKAGTPLKRDILKEWFKEEQRFFLTGGSALGLFYLDHRLSYDLDFFSSEPVETKEIQNLILKVAKSIGAESETIRTSPDFHRFLFIRGEDKEIIDVVVDRAPQLEVEKTQIGSIRVDTIREIIANKLSALPGRAELKDLVDLYYLEKKGYNLISAVPDAIQKDVGWEPAVVSMVIDSIDTSSPPDLLLNEWDQQDFEAFVDQLRLAMASLVFPNP